jgi:hypothetical protein
VPIRLTRRLAAKVELDFPEIDRPGVIQVLERVNLGSWRATRPPQGRERVLAAVLALTRGAPARLAESIRIAERDGRDALVWGGLGNPDWPERLDDLLGPS